MFRFPIAALVAAFTIAVWPGGFAHAGDLVERTKNLLGKINIFNGKPDPVCDERTPASAAPALQRATAGKITPKPAVVPFKSEGDLRKYLDCYVVEPGRMKIVTEQYLPLIAQAAKDFDIPKTLLACLIFRESRFDINARSGTGAIGLGQHLRGTMADISRVVGDDFSDLPKLQALHSSLSSRDSSLSAQELKDMRYARTRIMGATQAAQWKNYFTNLSSLKLHKGPPPKVVSTKTITTPSIAIGATAFYLQSILIHFQKTLDPTLSLEQSDKDSRNYDALLAAAGAYNMGPGAASGMLEEIRPPNPKKWIERLKKSNEETAGHIQSIQNCLSSPAASGSAWSGPMGSPNNDCSSPLDPKPILPGGINELPAEYRNPVKSATLTKPTPKKAKAAKPAVPKKQPASTTTKKADKKGAKK
jgi:hypothetical protein